LNEDILRTYMKTAGIVLVEVIVQHFYSPKK
jgi:hypothetical protein